VRGTEGEEEQKEEEEEEMEKEEEEATPFVSSLTNSLAIVLSLTTKG